MRRLSALLLLVACAGGSQPPAAWVGSIEAEWVQVAAPQPGWITAMAVQAGDAVEPGDALFALDTEQQQLELAAAQARLAQAEAELARNETLRRQGLASQSREDALLAERDSAAAARDLAAWRLDQRTVTARRAGRIEAVHQHAGEYAAAGVPVLSLLPPNGLKLRFYVPQAELPRLAVGETVEVQADGLRGPVSARISWIAQRAEFTPPVIFSPGSRERMVFAVEARLPAGSALHPGLAVDVRPP